MRHALPSGNLCDILYISSREKGTLWSTIAFYYRLTERRRLCRAIGFYSAQSISAHLSPLPPPPLPPSPQFARVSKATGQQPPPTHPANIFCGVNHWPSAPRGFQRVFDFIWTLWRSFVSSCAMYTTICDLGLEKQKPEDKGEGEVTTTPSELIVTGWQRSIREEVTNSPFRFVVTRQQRSKEGVTISPGSLWQDDRGQKKKNYHQRIWHSASLRLEGSGQQSKEFYSGCDLSHLLFTEIDYDDDDDDYDNDDDNDDNNYCCDLWWSRLQWWWRER